MEQNAHQPKRAPTPNCVDYRHCIQDSLNSCEATLYWLHLPHYLQRSKRSVNLLRLRAHCRSPRRRSSPAMPCSRSLAAVQDAGDLDELTTGELRSAREQELVTADPSWFSLLDSADELFRHVIGRLHRAYTEAGADPIAITVPSLKESIVRPLPYLDDYIDLVERLRTNPTIARDLLQTTELTCFEVLLGGEAWMSPAFGHLFTAEHKGLLLVAMRCLKRIAGDQVAGYLAQIQDLKVFPGQIGVPDRSAAPTLPSSQRNSSSSSPCSEEQPTIEGLELS